jgi:hypothetical protein
MGIKMVVWMVTGISLLIMASIDSLLANDGSGADCGICHIIHEPAAVALPGTDGQADAAVTRMRVIKDSEMSGWCNHCHGVITQQAIGFDSHSAHPGGLVRRGLGSTSSKDNSPPEGGGLSYVLTSRISQLTFATGHIGIDRGEVKVPAANSPATPNETTEVMCLSCHCAHARGFDHLQRRESTAELLCNESRYGSGRHHPDQASAIYQDASAGTFAAYQRTLCRKCHGKE